MTYLTKLFNTKFIDTEYLIRVFTTKTSSPYISHVKHLNTKFGELKPKLFAFNTGYYSHSDQILKWNTIVKATPYTVGVAGFTTMYRGAEYTARVIPLAPVTCYVGHVLLSVANLRITVSESSYGYSVLITLSDVDQIHLIEVDAPLLVSIGDETYKFIVDSTPVSKQGNAAPELSVRGISPIRLYEEPRHRGISKIWEEPALASTMAKSLMPDLEWRVVDWVIPAYRAAIESETPLKFVSRLASSCGAILTASKTGIPIVQYEYPIPTTEYSPTNIKHSLNDLDHLTTSIKENVPMDGVNYLVLSDARGEFETNTDLLESEVLRIDSARLKVYPNPIRPLDITHTSNTPLTLTRLKDLEDVVHKEDIEIFNGRGGLQYPIYAILNVEYLSLPLTGLVYTDGGRELTSTNETACGLIRITYVSKRIEYLVTGVSSEKVQFILQEEE